MEQPCGGSPESLSLPAVGHNTLKWGQKNTNLGPRDVKSRTSDAELGVGWSTMPHGVAKHGEFACVSSRVEEIMGPAPVEYYLKASSLERRVLI